MLFFGVAHCRLQPGLMIAVHGGQVRTERDACRTCQRGQIDDEIRLLAVRFGIVVMGVFAATFLLIPSALAALFSNELRVIAATIPLLQIAALFQLSDGAQAIAAGALRGLGETRATFVGNIVGHYVIGLPLMLGLAFAAIFALYEQLLIRERKPEQCLRAFLNNHYFGMSVFIGIALDYLFTR